MTVATIFGRPLRGVTDADEVLVPQTKPLTSYFLKTEEGQGKSVKVSRLTHLRHFEHWDVEQEAAHEIILRFIRENAHLLPALRYAQASVKSMKLYTDWWAATARSSVLEDPTRKQLARLYPDCFQDVILTGHADPFGPVRSKLDVCRELDADFIVDDSLSTVVECAENGIFSILFGNYPWNQFRGPLPRNLVRARDWRQVKRIVERRFLLP